MDIIQVSTSVGHTIYKVGDHTLRLWIITGGQPALALQDNTCTQTYPIKDTRWTMEHWKIRMCDGCYGCYDHQDPTNIQGPTFDVLPDGAKSIYDFLAQYDLVYNYQQKENIMRDKLIMIQVKTDKGFIIGRNGGSNLKAIEVLEVGKGQVSIAGVGNKNKLIHGGLWLSQTEMDELATQWIACRLKQMAHIHDKVKEAKEAKVG